MKRLKKYIPKPTKTRNWAPVLDYVLIKDGFAHVTNLSRAVRVPCDLDVEALVPLRVMVDVLKETKGNIAGAWDSKTATLNLIYDVDGVKGTMSIKGLDPSEFPNVEQVDRPAIGMLQINKKLKKSEINDIRHSLTIQLGHKRDCNEVLEFVGNGTINVDPMDLLTLPVNKPMYIHKNGDGIVELRQYESDIRFYLREEV